MRDQRGTGVAGAAVMLTGRTALTCAHVVETALGLGPSYSGGTPGGVVRVDFPGVGAGQVVAARVVDGGWLRSPPVGDLAVLRLEEAPPDGVRAAPLARCGDGTGARVRVFGHPAGVPEGLWARGEVVGAGGTHPGWRQIDGVDLAGAAVERGFSGAGVFDVGREAVVGVLATVLVPGGRAGRVSWMIPLDVLDGTAFEVRGPAEGARVLPPRVLWGLVDRLLAMDSVREDAGAQLLGMLPVAIAGGVGRRGSARMQLFEIVRRCGDFADGPGTLVEAVQWMEGSTTAVDDFVAEARRTWPDRLGDDG
ncbi:trypsin-like peptidase domain-containing protein [Streptomyces sp. NPDC048290]|uniref:effector-associated domain 2-containing protein n=1 Tax=Streptomyces sp. NPDC048290 TaxID=3155811 RepID=UPI00344939BE